MKQHHSEGRWCGSNFRTRERHRLEGRWCSLDLQGTRRCLQEINDAKHTSEMWENIHRRWAIPWRLRFLQNKLEILFYSTTKHQVMFIIISSNVNSLQSSFSTTMTLDHHTKKLTILKQCLVNRRDLKSILMTVGKLFKLNWQFFFFSCDWT